MTTDAALEHGSAVKQATVITGERIYRLIGSSTYYINTKLYLTYVVWTTGSIMTLVTVTKRSSSLPASRDQTQPYIPRSTHDDNDDLGQSIHNEQSRQLQNCFNS